jgi:hypothetical protein
MKNVSRCHPAESLRDLVLALTDLHQKADERVRSCLGTLEEAIWNRGVIATQLEKATRVSEGRRIRLVPLPDAVSGRATREY